MDTRFVVNTTPDLDPSLTDLSTGQILINAFDGKLFLKTTGNEIKEVGEGTGGGGIATTSNVLIDGGTYLQPNTLIDGGTYL